MDGVGDLLENLKVYLWHWVRDLEVLEPLSVRTSHLRAPKQTHNNMDIW